MQVLDKEQINKRKQQILDALAKKVTELRGEKSQFILSSENDISGSIISTIERGMKDPQLTTIFKLAEAFDLKTWQFVKLFEEELPEDFCLIDK